MLVDWANQNQSQNLIVSLSSIDLSIYLVVHPPHRQINQHRWKMTALAKVIIHKKKAILNLACGPLFSSWPLDCNEGWLTGSINQVFETELPNQEAGQQNNEACLKLESTGHLVTSQWHGSRATREGLKVFLNRGISQMVRTSPICTFHVSCLCWNHWDQLLPPSHLNLGSCYLQHSLTSDRIFIAPLKGILKVPVLKGCWRDACESL